MLIAAAQPNAGLGAQASGDLASRATPPPIVRPADALAGLSAVPNSNIALRERARLVRLSRLPCRTGFQLAAFVDEPWARTGGYAQRCSTHLGINDFN
jgi:hypothetical protein